MPRLFADWRTRVARKPWYLRLLALGVCLAAVLVVAAEIVPGVRVASRPAAAAPVADFSLLDQEGRHHQLYRYAHSRAVVLFVHGVGCNITRDSLPELKTLGERFTVHNDGVVMKLRKLFPEYSDGTLTMRVLRRIGFELERFALWRWRKESAERNVVFLMINANSQDDRSALQKDAQLFGIGMPILKDDTQLVAKKLGVDRTAEALLIDTRTWQIAYRGPVDDRLYFEAKRDRARHHYLRDAIDTLVSGRKASVAAPLPYIGCSISNVEQKKDVSYASEVAPILLQKCVTCHQAGGIAPWAMDSHERVKGWSAMMREVLISRRMPPWHADPAVASLANDRSLSVQEIRTLVDWIDAGAQPGGGPDPLAQYKPQPVSEWPLGEPDLIIDLPRQDIPSAGVLDYRYLEVRLPIDRDVWVRAVHLRPSNRAVMHHSFAFLKLPAQWSHLQNKDDFTGLNGFFAAYAAGLHVEPFPAGSGYFVPKGSALEFQLHYTPVGYAATDNPKIAIYLHKDIPPRELIVATAHNNRFRIPRYVHDHPVEARYVFQQDALLHSFIAHMHLRGVRMSYEAHYPDGRNEMLLSVPRYQFSWQSLYILRQPKPIPAGTEIRVRGAFDNSEFNPANPDPSKMVWWGAQSWEEMFIGYMLVTVPRRTPDKRSSASGS